LTRAQRPVPVLALLGSALGLLFGQRPLELSLVGPAGRVLALDQRRVPVLPRPLA
jgi:hypothetical protein